MRWTMVVPSLACGASDPSEPSEPSEPVRENEPPVEPRVEPSIARPDWAWVGEASEPDPAATRIRDAGGIECTHTIDDDTYATRLECRRGESVVWYRQDRSGVHVAMAQSGETLLVARFGRIRSGCSVYAYDIDTGAERWRVRLEGLGPISHSQYLNAVQIRRERDHLIVFGDEAAGKYIEVLDLAQHAVPRQLGLWRESNGAWTAHAISPEPTWRDFRPTSAPPEGEAAGRTFDWQGDHAGVRFEHSERVRSGAVECVFEGDAEAVELVCREDGTLLWGWRVADRWQAGAKLLGRRRSPLRRALPPWCDGMLRARVRSSERVGSLGAIALGRGRGRTLGISERRSRTPRGGSHHRARLGERGSLHRDPERYIEILNATDGATLGHRSFDR